MLPEMLYPLDRAETDVAIVGSGAAGMTAALFAAREGAQVLLLDKAAIGRSGATVQANAAASAPSPLRWESHAEDVIRVGRGEADPRVVETLSRNAERVFKSWLEWGVPFRLLPSGEFERLSGLGHSEPRSITAGYPMGEKSGGMLRRAVSRELRITAAPYTPAVALVRTGDTITGLLALDAAAGRWKAVSARAVVLATGGAQALYHASTTSDFLTGDGYALALRSGARMTGLEFVLFNPVGLVRPKAIKISKTILSPLRNIAGTFRNARGERFMPAYHPDGDRAPWEILSYAMTDQIERGLATADGSLYLAFDGEDDRARLEERYPDMLRHLEAADIDIFATPVEVAPMAHFFCGGIEIDGRAASSIPGLFAAGEAAGGIHGATRLGSDALTAAAVFGAVAGEEAAARARTTASAPSDEVPALVAEAIRRASAHAHRSIARRDAIRDQMSASAGPLRTKEGLERAERALVAIASAPTADPPAAWMNDPFLLITALEVANAAEVGLAITRAALGRRESRGTHFRADFPHEAESGARAGSR